MARSQTNSSNLDYLCLEGLIDLEVAVLIVKMLKGDIIGSFVNYACRG